MVPPRRGKHAPMKLWTVLKVPIKRQFAGGYTAPAERTRQQRGNKLGKGKLCFHAILLIVFVLIAFQSRNGLVRGT